MGIVYTAPIDPTAVTVAVDIFEIVAPSGALVIVHDWEVYQTSDVGDAAEEILSLYVIRGDLAVASGSGGVTITAQPTGNENLAFSGTIEAMNTTLMSAGSPDTLERLGNHGWNIRVPREKVYTPETRQQMGPSKRWALRLPVAPADSLTIAGTVTFEVVGGS